MPAIYGCLKAKSRLSKLSPTSQQHILLISYYGHFTNSISFQKDTLKKTIYTENFCFQWWVFVLLLISTFIYSGLLFLRISKNVDFGTRSALVGPLSH